MYFGRIQISKKILQTDLYRLPQTGGGKTYLKSRLKSILINTKFLFQVSDDLEAIIGVSEASRAQCIKHLWAYLKEKNLQNADNKAFFTPDKKMAKVFGKDSIRGFSMSKYLGAHLSAIDD